MNIRTFILLAIIVGPAAYLRFHRLSEIYVFNLDEEYQATYAWTLVKDFHPIWIGLAAAALEFYIGPYTVYLTAILLAFSKGDPIITAYFAAFLGVATTALIFWTGKKIFNLTTGVIASLLYAGLPLFVFFDQKYWNPSFGPIITILLFLTLILTKTSKRWWIMFAALSGAIFETHLPPFPLLLIGLMFFIKGKYWQDIKLILISLLVFLVFYWPLLVFDFNHNFSNLKVLTRIEKSSNISFNPVEKFGTLLDTMGRFWYLAPSRPNADEVNFGCSSLSSSNGFEIIDKYTQRTYSPFWISLISTSLFLFFILKYLRSDNFPYKILALFLAVSGFSFLIYPGGSYEYYALTFLTLFTFVPAILISHLKGKMRMMAFGLILVIMLLGINTVLNTSDEFSLAPKKRIIKEVMEVVGEKSFAIEGRGICHNWEGWRYLFKVYGRVPDKSYTDSSLGWLYPEEIGTKTPIYTIILSEDRIPLKEDLSATLSIKEGGYRAYIKKNQ